MLDRMSTAPQFSIDPQAFWHDLVSQFEQTKFEAELIAKNNRHFLCLQQFNDTDIIRFPTIQILNNLWIRLYGKARNTYESPGMSLSPRNNRVI